MGTIWRDQGSANKLWQPPDALRAACVALHKSNRAGNRDLIVVSSTVMDADTEKRPPDWMVASLERSEAQIAVGEAVPLEPVLQRLRASIARMHAAALE